MHRCLFHFRRSQLHRFLVTEVTVFTPFSTPYSLSSFQEFPGVTSSIPHNHRRPPTLLGLEEDYGSTHPTCAHLSEKDFLDVSRYKCLLSFQNEFRSFSSTKDVCPDKKRWDLPPCNLSVRVVVSLCVGVVKTRLTDPILNLQS